MKNLYVIFLLCISNFVAGQAYVPFPNDSAVWVTKKTSQVSSCCGTLDILQLGDTTINNKIYHKIYYFTTNNLNSFYRESNKKIYSKYPVGGVFGNDTAEFVLYDFNMLVGDSMNVKIPSNWITTGGPIYTQPKIYLDSMGTVTLNSVVHKTYSFTTHFTGCIFQKIKWIEGIGSDAGLFYNLNYYDWASCMSYPAPYSFILTCFSKNNLLIYNNNCTITSIPNLIDKFNLYVYPNPSSLILTIQTEEDITSLAIYNTIGEACNYKPLVSKSIDVSNLPNGIYYLELKTTKGLVRKKFVKE